MNERMAHGRLALFLALGMLAGCASSTSAGDGGRTDAAPDSAADAGSDATADASALVCGNATCLASEVCVHTVSGGGPCQQPQDGGCPAGTILSGDCCVAHNESFECKPRPAACASMLACSCASELCTGGCQCQTSTGDQLECGCFFP